MALIRFPEGQQRSGSSGGLVFSRNRFGAYIRPRTVPVNPNTDRQVTIRNAVRALTIAWNNTLTQDQRDAWDLYGANISWLNKLGDSVNLTGLNHYVRCNTQRITLNGFPRIDVAPGIFTLATAEQNLSAVASEGTQDFVIDGDAGGDWIADPGSLQCYYMSIPQNPSIKFCGGPYRLIGVAAIGPPPFPVTLSTAWPFVEGQRLWLRSRIQRSDGRLSEFAQVNFLSAA